MYLQHFGLKYPPLGKNTPELWDDGALAQLKDRFQWLVGHPRLAYTLDRAPYAALASRIQVRLQLQPISARERFKNLIEHALKQAGCQHTLLSDPALELLRQASQGLPRQAGLILNTAMQLAVPKGLNHLPDELLQQAIEVLR